MKYLTALCRARKQGKALGAFNIFNDVSIRAVIAAAEVAETPVILQTSVKTVKQLGAVALHNMVRSAADTTKMDVFLHLDHCTDIEIAKTCVMVGWDSVMYDGSALPLEENIKNSQTIVSFAHEYGVAVEGELGRIGGVEEDIVVDENYASQSGLEESLIYVRESGVDAFAPAIGTAHGVYKGKPCINFELVEQLSKSIPEPIVIHGGTGLEEPVFQKLISCGGCKINVSTALKNAYFDGILSYIAQTNYGREPLKLDSHIENSIRQTAAYHMSIFNGGQ